MITVCFTYFRSLSLANLEAALFSLRMQDFTNVAQIVIIDNDSPDSAQAVQRVIDGLGFPVPVILQTVKHGDSSRTHSWSTNAAVELVRTPWVFFTRADYVLDYDIIRRYRTSITSPDCFITGDVYHLHQDVAACEQVKWRHGGPSILRALPGTRASYTVIDSGVWMASVDAFRRVGGLDESLTAWGHAQTHFQWKLHKQGTAFVRIPEILFYHPMHGAPRDIALAHQQLAVVGADIREMWSRYEGEQPYR